jgi:hypothetical protein
VHIKSSFSARFACSFKCNKIFNSSNSGSGAVVWWCRAQKCFNRGKARSRRPIRMLEKLALVQLERVLQQHLSLPSHLSPFTWLLIETSSSQLPLGIKARALIIHTPFSLRVAIITWHNRSDCSAHRYRELQSGRLRGCEINFSRDAKELCNFLNELYANSRCKWIGAAHFANLIIKRAAADRWLRCLWIHELIASGNILQTNIIRRVYTDMRKVCVGVL